MVKIGLFGGTFNPIHWGHLRSAEEIREIFELRYIIFIPASIPPHKTEEGIIPFDHRLEMVKLAIKENPYFSVSDVERKRPGKSYSVETIDHFKKEYKKMSPFFILGMDAFQEIASWKDYQRLFSLCNLVVINRPGHQKKLPSEILPLEIAKDFCYDTKGNRFLHPSQCAIYFQEVSLLDISSRVIRKRIKENKSIKYLLPEEVEGYIRLNRLYKVK